MGIEAIYLLGTVLFTVGGWQLGKSIWRQKRADPGRGKWYGAFLGFLFGFVGIITLLGISWRWHPRSEFAVARLPEEMDTRRSRSARPGRLAAVGLVAMVIALGLAASGVSLGNDALRSMRWADQVRSDGARISRAECAEVTLDWEACYMADGRGRTDREWRAKWSQQGSDQAILAGTALLGALLCGCAAGWAWRARSVALRDQARRDGAAAALRLGVAIGDIDPAARSSAPAASIEHPSRPAC